MAEYIQSKDAQKMVGPTGGIQGAQGTLFGVPYEVGSWQDKLIEAFSGTHDMFGGKVSGLYGAQGNIKRGMSESERKVYNKWAAAAIVPATPFALAEGLPPDIWKAISIFLGGRKMSGVNKFILSSLSLWFALGGCSMGFVPTGLTPAKAYGAYWFKPGMTLESWRQDWVECGGRSNGQYSSDAPTGSAVDVLINVDKQKRQSLATCMQSKGYTYHDTRP